MATGPTRNTHLPSRTAQPLSFSPSATGLSRCFRDTLATSLMYAGIAPIVLNSPALRSKIYKVELSVTMQLELHSFQKFLHLLPVNVRLLSIPQNFFFLPGMHLFNQLLLRGVNAPWRRLANFVQKPHHIQQF